MGGYRKGFQSVCPGSLKHEKVLALVVKLLDETLIRIGNESYAAENESYGLTNTVGEIPGGE